MYNIDINEFIKKDLNILNIIDIREKNSYLSGHIKNAKNISEYELINFPFRYLNKNEIYYIYCDKGNRSKNVVRYLNSIGYLCVNILGGYSNYLFSR